MLSIQDLMDLPPVGVEAGAADGLAQDVEVDIETGAQAFGQVPSYSDAEKEAFGPLPFGVEWVRFPGTTSLWMLQETKSKWLTLILGAGALAALWFFVIRR